MNHWDSMNGWMSGGHGITMLLGWAVIIVGLIAVGYALGRSRKKIQQGLMYVVVALMLVFEGLRFGIIEDLRAFPAALPGDFVIVEKNVGQFAMSASQLPQFTRRQAEAIDGVV
jgi:hypothetical protein